ncbi:Protein of uncharacterised function (DUF3169) [Streptococcus pneumoniae]|nr:Protein of uncharacterised function (DUF3169) [Streptococcus pneumoniae]
MKKKRRLLFLMSIVLGGFLGMFVGMFKARVESHEIILDVKALMAMDISYLFTDRFH